MGVAICLLLDESGSMSRAHMQPSHSKASMALQVAVCMAEALRTTPGVEFEVYSFTSCGTGNDNFMKYLYGKKNPDLAAMGHYGRGSVNYDYMALEQAGRMFIENTSDRAQRIMIVLSDGAPCGEGRNGETAEQATKRASTALEKLGIKVIQVAIEDFRSMNCYKHVLKFTDIPNLINKMRGLITRIIKQASEVAQ
jgi:cobalamin biosynthesis protein CobT